MNGTTDYTIGRLFLVSLNPTRIYETDHLGPRTAEGVNAWDTGMTLVETAKKLGVSSYHYIKDRISGARQMPSLAGLIEEQAKLLGLGASWNSS